MNKETFEKNENVMIDKDKLDKNENYDINKKEPEQNEKSKTNQQTVDISFLHKIKEEDNISIPDSLKPDRIEQMLHEAQMNGTLENRKKKNNNHKLIKKVSKVAAILLLVGVGAMAVDLCYHDGKSQYNKAAIKREVKKQNTHATDETIDYAAANYTKIYEKLENIKERQMTTRGDIGYETQNIVEDYEVMGEAKSTNNREYSMAENESATTDYSQTNVRTQGIDECDIVKTDGKYIYTYDDNTDLITIYLAQKEKTEQVGEINLNSYNITVNSQGFYIADNTLVVMGEGNADEVEENNDTSNISAKRKSSNREEDISNTEIVAPKNEESMGEKCTRTLLFDITDRTQPEFLHGFFQDGNYDDSRLSNGILYVFSKKYVQTSKLKRDQLETYIPKIQNKLVNGNDIFIQPDEDGQLYQLISSISLSKQEYVDQKTIFGNVGTLYVSSEHIYLFDHSYNDTFVLSYSYKDGKMTKQGSQTISGYLYDDYSVDEKDGYLRMVMQMYSSGTRTTALSIFDENLNRVGCLKNIAPDEELKSVRFIKNMAYFVTYRNTDPLFAVDVSNPKKPVMKGYLKIPGFSSYLHPFDATHLLGIGIETDENSRELGIKCSMFDISDPENIKETDKYVMSQYYYCEVLENPNALLIDTQKNVIGMQLNGYAEDGTGDESTDYVVLSYDQKDGFTKQMKEKLNRYGEIAKGRGVVIDDYLYIVNIGNKISAYKWEVNK